jgi:hypothetical protein
MCYWKDLEGNVSHLSAVVSTEVYFCMVSCYIETLDVREFLVNMVVLGNIFIG